MSTIEDLERKVQSLRDQLSAATHSLQEARIAACSIKIGDVVACDGVRRKVSRIEAKYASVHLYGMKLKIDGQWGRRESYIGIAREGNSSYGWHREVGP